MFIHELLGGMNMNEKLGQLIDIESSDYKNLFEDYNELIGQSKIDEAIKLLETIPKGHKDYSKALYRKSLAVYFDDEEKSFEIFQQALTMEFGNSNYSPAFGNLDNSEDFFLFALNMIYIFNDFQNAIKYLDLSLKIKPDQSEALNFKAISFGFLHKYKKAIKLINKAIKIDPDNSSYWNNKGAFLLEQNYPSKAIKAFDRAIELEPNVDSWSNKGTVYYREGEFVKALNCYDEALKLDPLNISSVINKASIYSELGQFKLADEYFQIACKLDSNDFTYLVEMAKHLINKGEFKKSIQFLDKSLEIYEDFALSWMYKSIALSELGMDDESEICFKKAVKLDPDSLSVFDEVFVIDD